MDTNSNLTFEAKYEDIISSKDGKCSRRIARFLEPRARNQTEAAAAAASKTAGVSSENITFNRWDYSRTEWESLVDRLALNNAACWNRTGILDAVLGSIYEIHWNQNLVLGLVEFWCPETNTFVFPWGEATVTLEDVMILGGFSVTGEILSDTPATGGTEITAKMDNQVEVTACYSEWLEQFRKWGNQETEHLWFLSSWLSKLVFPSLPLDSVHKYDFPLAAKLSRNRKLALAPAVLASLYTNLTLLKEKMMSGSELCVIAKPFELLILWAYEHFPSLALFPNRFKPGEPRIARWHDLSIDLSVDDVKSVVAEAGSFEWRPYAADLKNWRHLSYYKGKQQIWPGSVFDDGDDLEMESYFRSLLPCDLVGLGLDCRQMYQPQRVAMQFGMDQDVPTAVMNFGVDGNWSFFVPARSFSPGFSLRYAKWWKESMMAPKRTMINDDLESIVVASKRRKLGGEYDGNYAGDPIII